MKYIYSVRDSVSGNMGDICSAVNDTDIVRSFRNQINSSNFPRYLARDLSVVCLGQYDDTAGIVSGYESFRPVAYGSDLLEPEKE